MAQKTESNAVETQATSEVRPYQAILTNIQRRAALDSAQTDPFEFASKALDAMARASTLEEMILANQQSGLVAAEDIFGQPFTVTDLSFSISAEQFRKGGLGAWVIITASLDNGEEIQIKSGAVNVVGFMYLAQEKGMLPVRLKITGKATANGVLQQISLP